MEPGNYTFKDLSKALYIILQSEYPGPSNVTHIEFDDITMKSKFFVKSGIIAIRVDENSIFNTILALKHGWDYKYYNEYISQKNVNLNTTDKIHLKCDFINRPVDNGLRQPILYSFVLDKKPRFKVFSEPETIHFKKKSSLNATLF